LQASAENNRQNNTSFKLEMTSEVEHSTVGIILTGLWPKLNMFFCLSKQILIS